MRVRIQYSVDIEEIPMKISGFLEDVCHGLSAQNTALSTEIGNLNKGSDLDGSLRTIDEVRKEMAILDSILADAHAILGGYVSTINQPEILEPTETEVHSVISEG